MKIARVDMAEFYKLPHPQLKSYLQRQVRGQSVVYETPWGENLGFWNYFEEWKTYLEKNLTEFPDLLEYELGLAKKVGPNSVQKPLAERMEDIESYYTSVINPGDEVLPEAIHAAWNRLGRIRGLRVLNKEEVLAQMKKSTNSGSPYFTKRRLVIERGLVGDIERRDSAWYTTNSEGSWRTCATLGWRGQPGGPSPEDVKQRVLWMFPMDVNTAEAGVYVPFILASQRARSLPSWMGNNAVDAQMTNLMDSTDPDDWLICTDFTKFDQHYSHCMQVASLAFWDKCFRRDEAYETWRSEIFPIKYKQPLCISWGKFCFGDTGMESGSNGTNGDETVGHSSIQDEVAIINSTKLNPFSAALGDDGVLSGRGLSAEKVFACYEKHNQVMQLQKFYVDKESLEYLKRFHMRRYRPDGLCRGVYSTLWALGKLRFIERFHKPETWGAKAIVNRSLSVIENCEWHPLRKEFLELCIKGDRYRLGLDIPGYLDNVESEVQKSIDDGIISWQYTDSFNPKPASQWWTVRALREMRDG